MKAARTQDGSATRAVRILGTRGVPNRHGGFEAFAEELAPFLAARGWSVTVYCQEEGDGAMWETEWRGVRRVHVPVRGGGSLGTVVFDWRCTRHARREPGLALVLGYNTALFCAAYRYGGIPCLLNMDGMEWRRAKYTWAERAWFLANERLGCRLADHLIADHPEIARYLGRLVAPDRVTTIAYGARRVDGADPGALAPYGVAPHRYLLVIARPEPENSTLEIVRAYSARPRAVPLVVLGAYRRGHPYHRRVLDVASPDVRFPGAVYDRAAVDALRRFARLYVHGHTVGGTNPALVEALGAGAAVLAHDNPYNRWVAGDAAEYFGGERECAARLDAWCEDTPPASLQGRRRAAAERHAAAFQLEAQLARYEALLAAHAGVSDVRPTELPIAVGTSPIPPRASSAWGSRGPTTTLRS